MVLDEVSKIDEDNDEVGNFGNFTEVHTAIKKMYREISNIMSKENGIFDETDIERFMKLWDEYQVNETIFITNNKARQLLSNSLLIQAKQFSDELKEARAMNDDNSQKPENMIKNKAIKYILSVGNNTLPGIMSFFNSDMWSSDDEKIKGKLAQILETDDIVANYIMMLREKYLTLFFMLKTYKKMSILHKRTTDELKRYKHEAAKTSNLQQKETLPTPNDTSKPQQNNSEMELFLKE